MSETDMSKFFIFAGFFGVLCLHSHYIRCSLLPVYPNAVVVLRGQYICLGSVCVAHR